MDKRWRRKAAFQGRVLVVAWAVLGAAGLIPAQAVYPEIQTLVVIGDGLSDTGRSGGVDTNPPELVWVDYLASLLGIPEAAPYNPATNPGGRNFAFFSATAEASDLPFPDGPDQADSYLVDALAGGPPATDALIVVWLGTWDVVKLTAGDSAIGAADELAQILRRLAAAGGKQFLVPDLFPLEMSPDFLNSPEPIASLTDEFNQRLAIQLDLLRREYPAVRFIGMRTHDLFLDIKAAPEAYGIEDIETPSSFPFHGVEDYSLYLWWDYLYPTSSVHAMLADLAAYEIEATMGGLSGANVDLSWNWNSSLARWELSLLGPPLDLLTLEVSHDLKTWLPLRSFPRFDGNESFSPTTVPTAPTFYRAR